MQSDIVARAERDLMACILVDPAQTLKEIRPVLSHSDFSNDVARAVYDAATSLADSGKTIDATVILANAAEQGTPIEESYAAEIMHLYCTTANAAVTAELVHNAAIQRAAAAIGIALADDRYTALDAVAKLQELMKRQNSRLQRPLEAANAFMDYVDAAAMGEVTPFVPTGFSVLDKQLEGGFVQSGLITMAARPGTGKTTAALNLAERVAEQGKTVLYISLEMDYRQLWARRTAAYSGLSYSKIYRADLTDAEWGRLNNATEILSQRPFYIHDKPCTVEDIERIARGAENPALIVVDHIGLIKNSTGRSRYEQMTDVSHRLKQLALSTGVPILALCQLNRQSEGRESKLPTIADLRDTGAIEEDSDVVMLLHRPAMYASEDTAPKPWETQELQIIVGKNRHGMQGLVRLDFNGMTARISNTH